MPRLREPSVGEQRIFNEWTLRAATKANAENELVKAGKKIKRIEHEYTKLTKALQDAGVLDRRVRHKRTHHKGGAHALVTSAHSADWARLQQLGAKIEALEQRQVECKVDFMEAEAKLAQHQEQHQLDGTGKKPGATRKADRYKELTKKREKQKGSEREANGEYAA